MVNDFYTPYEGLTTETLEQVSQQYTDNLKLYLAIANWKTILKCMFAEYNNVPEATYLHSTKHPCQIHYGYSLGKPSSIEELVKNTTSQILKILNPNPNFRYEIIHLGSGIGGCDFQIAEQYKNITSVGVSISKSQIDLSIQLAKLKGISDRVKFYEMDYSKLPENFNSRFDFAYAIESLDHTPQSNLHNLFSGIRKCLKPGSLLVISDGFFNRIPSEKERKMYLEFLRGWDLPELQTPSNFINIATGCGFKLVSNIDKTKNILEMAHKLKLRTYFGTMLIWLAEKFNISYLKEIGLSGDKAHYFSKTGIVQEKIFKRHICSYRLMVFQAI